MAARRKKVVVAGFGERLLVSSAKNVGIPALSGLGLAFVDDKAAEHSTLIKLAAGGVGLAVSAFQETGTTANKTMRLVGSGVAAAVTQDLVKTGYFKGKEILAERAAKQAQAEAVEREKALAERLRAELKRDLTSARIEGLDLEEVEVAAKKEGSAQE